MRNNKLNIAIIGTRGIPGNYGGFETFAEKLSIGLVERGHKVTVYCPTVSSQTGDQYYKGIRRVIIPNIPSKSLDKLTNSFLSCIHSIGIKYKLILFLGVSPVLFTWLPRLNGKKTIINIDGLEWKRRKWNPIAASYLKLSEALSGRFCHEVVTDSKAIQKYYKKTYSKDSTFIAYGADIGSFEDDSVLKKYGLTRNKYILQVCRLESENNSHIVINEYNKLQTDMPLVIVGSSPYSKEYEKQLMEMADERVIFLGGVFGHDYNVLRSNPFCYVHAHEVGGTNPALLESLAAGNCVVVLDVNYNLEVIGDAGFSFTKREGSLSSMLEELISKPYLIPKAKERSVKRIQKNYTWEKIVNQYEELFYKTIGD